MEAFAEIVHFLNGIFLLNAFQLYGSIRLPEAAWLDRAHRKV
jgi:hypothetical protein